MFKGTFLLLAWLPFYVKSVTGQYPPQPPGRPQGNPNAGLSFNHRAIIDAVVEELTNETMSTMEELKPRFVAMAGDAVMNKPPKPPHIPAGLIGPPGGSGRAAGNRYGSSGEYSSSSRQREQTQGAQEQESPFQHRRGHSRHQQHGQYPAAGQEQKVQYGPGHGHQPQSSQYGRHPGAQPGTQFPGVRVQQGQGGQQYPAPPAQYGRGGQQYPHQPAQGHSPHRLAYRQARSNRRRKYKHYDYNEDDRIDGW